MENSEIQLQCLLVKSEFEEEEDEEAANTITTSKRRVSKLVYTKEFLSSFAMLDSCKTLPVAFDTSLLSGLSYTRTTTTRGNNNNSFDATTCATAAAHANSPESGIWKEKKTQISCNFTDLGILGNAAPPNLSICGAPPKLSICGAPPLVSKCGSKGSPLSGQNNGDCLLKKTIKPYRPPHLYKENLQSDKLSVYTYNHQLFRSDEIPGQDKLREKKDKKAVIEPTKEKLDVQEKQNISPDEHKENMNLKVDKFLKDSESIKAPLNDCNKLLDRVTSSAPNVNDAVQRSDVVEDLPKGFLPYSSDVINQPDEQERYAKTMLTHLPVKLEKKINCLYISLNMNPVTEISHVNKNSDPEINVGSDESSVVVTCKRIKLPHELMGCRPKKTNGKPSPYEDIRALIGLNLDSDDDDETEFTPSNEKSDLTDETELSPANGNSDLTDKTELSPFIENSNLIDEINLPDEESLITVDDYILVKQSMPMPVKTHFPASVNSDKGPNKLGNINASVTDKKSTQPDLAVPVKGLGSRHNNPLHAQIKPKPFTQPRQYQVAPKTKFPNVILNRCYPPSPDPHNFPIAVMPAYFVPAPVGSYFVDPMLQHGQIHMIGQPLQITEMATYADAWNHNFCQSYPQISFPGHQFPNSRARPRNPPIAVSNGSETNVNPLSHLDISSMLLCNVVESELSV
ncbi:hypothetical protein ACFE04_027785 [Oxalis oulophora]